MKKPMLESEPITPELSLSTLQLTHAQRPSDRYFVNQISAVSQGVRPVQLLCVVELVSAWHHARELGNNIAQTFTRHFSQSSHQSTLTKLEDTLKQLNTNLAHQLERFDVSPACVLLVTVGNEVYFSTLGSGRVLLLRNQRLSSIGGEAKDKDTAFTTVTSGELDEDDWLFCANGDFAELLRQLDPSALSDADVTELRSLIATQAELSDRRDHLNGVAVRFTPGLGQALTLPIGELESRTPISLPKISFPRFSLPKWRPGNVAFVATAARNLIGWAKRLSLRQRLIAVLAVIIVAALTVGLVRNVRPAPITAQAQPTILAELATTGANQRQLLIDKLSPETFHGLSAEDQTALQNVLAASSITLSALPNEAHQLPADIVSLDTLPNNPDELYVLDATGQIWQRRSGAMVKLEQKQPIISPVSLVVFAANKIVVSDEPGNIWLYDGTTAGPISLTLGAKMTTGKKLLEKFGANLYIYTTSDNQIFRVTNFGSDVSGAAVYTKTGVITNSPINDLAINGSVQLLGQSGRIISLLRNAPEALNIDVPVFENGRLASDANRIIAASGKFLFSYDAKGAVTKEQFLLSRAPITALTVGATGQVWLSIESKIYTLAN